MKSKRYAPCSIPTLSSGRIASRVLAINAVLTKSPGALVPRGTGFADLRPASRHFTPRKNIALLSPDRVQQLNPEVSVQG